MKNTIIIIYDNDSSSADTMMLVVNGEPIGLADSFEVGANHEQNKTVLKARVMSGLNGHVNPAVAHLKAAGFDIEVFDPPVKDKT